jgi:glycosyltransferase involved in cell wall biosynthesis
MEDLINMRVLQFVTGNFDVGGLSQIVFRWGSELNNKGTVFDYCCRNYYEPNQYTHEIKRSGGDLNYPNKSTKGIKKQINYFLRTYKQIKKYRYKVIHVHADTSYNMIKSSIIPRLMGVNHIILHSHSAGIDRHSSNDFSFRFLIRTVLHEFFRLLLPIVGTDYCACSEKAADWMYSGKTRLKTCIIDNAIDTSKFKYNDQERIIFRKTMGLDEYKLVGHVGRFVYQKNHVFILKIAEHLNKVDRNIKFVLVGDGELFSEIKDQANQKELNNVIFVGRSDCVNKWMQAFDTFIIPSHFEGLPVVGVEAQAAGLMCIFSDRVDKGTQIINDVKFLPIDNDSISIWLKELQKNLIIERQNNSLTVENSKFNIKSSGGLLYKMYKRFDSGEKNGE